MKVSDFNYELPGHLIARYPLKQRDSSRLMLLDKGSGDISGVKFKDICNYLGPGDCIVLNNTRVIPARLLGNRSTGGRVEIFLIEPFGEPPLALVRSSRRISPGENIRLEGGGSAKIKLKEGPAYRIEFDRPLDEALRWGHVPIPPYLGREAGPDDKKGYQTVYAEKQGATAAPTAGLHFTPSLLSDLKKSGVRIAKVTLHTSYGTFAPVKAVNVEDHKMHGEIYEVEKEAADEINEVKAYGGKIIAVGTTSTRVLETCSEESGTLMPGRGKSNLFIYPGYRFKIVDGVITNFHLPGSTLLMLVSAFAGKDLIDRAYGKAIDEGYRFYSYGDAMFIL